MAEIEPSKRDQVYNCIYLQSVDFVYTISCFILSVEPPNSSIFLLNKVNLNTSFTPVLCNSWQRRGNIQHPKMIPELERKTCCWMAQQLFPKVESRHLYGTTVVEAIPPSSYCIKRGNTAHAV